MDLDEEDGKAENANNNDDENGKRNEDSAKENNIPIEKKVVQQSIINGVDVTLFEPFASKLKDILQTDPSAHWPEAQKLFSSFIHSFTTSMVCLYI